MAPSHAVHAESAVRHLSILLTRAAEAPAEVCEVVAPPAWSSIIRAIRVAHTPGSAGKPGASHSRATPSVTARALRAPRRAIAVAVRHSVGDTVIS